jgi:hypothetical protein
MMLSWRDYPILAVKKAKHYVLAAPFEGYSERIGVNFVIPEGFEFDGDSVPRLPVIYMLLKNRTLIAAIVHDWMYSTGELGGVQVSRKTADLIFRDAMVAEGAKWYYRWPVYMGVRLGGWWPWRNAK